jgi:hypothetical protein
VTPSIQNITFVFLKNDIKTKPKRFKLHQGFLKTKKKLFAVLKKLEWNKTKAFGPKILSTDRKRFVSIQNFVSKTNIFDTGIFRNESSKQKLSILKER